MAHCLARDDLVQNPQNRGDGEGGEAGQEGAAMSASAIPTLPEHSLNEPAFSMAIDPHADSYNNPPCYLPQANDQISQSKQLEPMGPIGPWATGKVDWSPMAGLTGTRPVVDKYSITRFSPNEWRARNLETVKRTNKYFDRAIKNEYQSKTTFLRLTELVAKTQNETTKNLKERAQILNKWKTTLENSIRSMAEEISFLEDDRLKLGRCLVILGVPEHIVKECIDKRTGRPDSELVRDKPEEELVNELALIAEVRRLLIKTREDFEQQQIENRAARERLESDWSDKKEAYEIDCLNIGLKNNSTTIMFYPGTVRQPAEQASQEYWSHFSNETLEECEKCRQKSVQLRQTLESILLSATRDIRTQAEIVEKAFVQRINCTQENLQRFEIDLKNCLQKLAETENRVETLKCAVGSFDSAMKVAQTRMNNRSYRPNVENCRDYAQKNLIEEVHTIQSGVTAMLAELDEAENVKNKLMQTRGALENQIMLKRRTLMIDREQCMLLRSHYPSTSALSGMISM